MKPEVIFTKSDSQDGLPRPAKASRTPGSPARGLVVTVGGPAKAFVGGEASV